MNKISHFIHHTLSEVIIDRLSHELKVHITAEELLIGLLQKSSMSLDELVEHDLSYEQIKELYENCEQIKFNDRAIASISGLGNIIPPGIETECFDSYIKHKGTIWVIHKNDADPHPSLPHAHNYQENLKLHLGNGALYRRTRMVGKIERKHLLAIREKIPNLQLPPLEF